MKAPDEADEKEAVQISDTKVIRRLKGAEIQFNCVCGEKVSIPFSFAQPIAKTFSIPCLCQMNYSVVIDRESSSITVEILGNRDQLETIF